MYQSSLLIDKKSAAALKKYFLAFLRGHKKIYCSALGRPVFFDKQPGAIFRRKDVNYRLESFFVAIDIIKHSRYFKKWDKNGELGFSISGVSKEGRYVTAHIREEKTSRKDRKLFLISFFHK